LVKIIFRNPRAREPRERSVGGAVPYLDDSSMYRRPESLVDSKGAQTVLRVLCRSGECHHHKAGTNHTSSLSFLHTTPIPGFQRKAGTARWHAAPCKSDGVGAPTLRLQGPLGNHTSLRQQSPPPRRAARSKTLASGTGYRDGQISSIISSRTAFCYGKPDKLVARHSIMRAGDPTL